VRFIDRCYLRPIYSDAAQLNSTRRRVELSCVAVNGPYLLTVSSIYLAHGENVQYRMIKNN